MLDHELCENTNRRVPSDHCNVHRHHRINAQVRDHTTFLFPAPWSARAREPLRVPDWFTNLLERFRHERNDVTRYGSNSTEYATRGPACHRTNVHRHARPIMWP